MEAFYQWRSEQAKDNPADLQSEPSSYTLHPA
jgi:hypothetical protein